MSNLHNSKRRIIHTIIIIFVSILLLAAAAGTAYAFRNYLMNAYARVTMSPAEYYSYLEKRNVAAIIDAFIPVSETSDPQDSLGTGIDVSSNMTINHDAVDPIVKSYLGTSLSEYEELFGITLESIGINALMKTDGEQSAESLTLKLNDVTLISADLFLNLLTGQTMLRLPELSDAYLSLSEGTDSASDQKVFEHLTKAETADFLTRYSDIIIDHIHEVSPEKDTTLTLDTLSEEYTTLKVLMRAEDLYEMEMEVLDAAENDAYLLNIAVSSGFTTEQYHQELTKLRDEFTASKDVLEDLTMMIYVDKAGRILGRNITSEDSVASIGYTILQDKGYFEYDFYLTEDTGKTLFDASGKHTWDAGVNNGTMTLMMVTDPETYEEFNCTISYEDIRTEIVNQQTFRYGTVTIDSLDLMGLQIILNMDSADQAQIDHLVFQMGAESLITVDTTTRYLSEATPDTPDEDAEIYSLNQSESFTATFDLESYFNRLSEQLGIDLSSLFNLLLMD